MARKRTLYSWNQVSPLSSHVELEFDGVFKAHYKIHILLRDGDFFVIERKEGKKQG